jgi:hypothetical protein
MKLTHTLLIGAASLVLAHAATAQTVIRIAGSNGDRNATNAAINNLLGGTGNYTYVAIAVNGANGTLTTSNFNNFIGTYNGQSVIIKTAYIGATGGIKAVAGTETVRFLPDSATGLQNPSPLTSSNPAQYVEEVPQFGVSTNFQSTSPYEGFYNGKEYKTLTQILTGVAPLRFIATPGFPGDNLTTSAAQALYSRGYIPLAFLTGLPADRNKTIFAIGRNHDAGQRFGALAEFGLGVNAVTKHYQPTVDANFVVTSQILWPRNSEASGFDTLVAGNGGFNSGANLANALKVVLSETAYKVGNSSATAGYYIGYVTPSDANGVLAGGANVGPNGPAIGLKWNGVAYSAQAVQEGQYTAWLYTRVIYPDDLGGLARTFADAVAENVISTTGNTGGGILINTLQVYRESESAPVTPKYL